MQWLRTWIRVTSRFRTYPGAHPQEGMPAFRADIDVATCGVISPLNALNYLIESLSQTS